MPEQWHPQTSRISRFILILVVSVPLSFGSWHTATCAAAVEQKPLIFSALHPDQSLVQNSVRAFAQDHRGFLWIGTLGGLHRFDGHQMVLVNDLDLAGSSLDIVRVSALKVDRHGDVWVGGAFGGLNRIRTGNGTIESFSDLTKPAFKSSGLDFSGIREGPGPFLWLVAGGNMFRLDPGDRTIEEVAVEIPASWGEERIVSSLPLGEGLHLVRGNRYLGILDETDGSINTLSLRNGSPLADLKIEFLTRLDDGSLWATGFPSCAVEIQGEGRQRFLVPHELPQVGRVLEMIQGEPGELWLRTYAGSICQWVPETGRFSVRSLELGEKIFPSNDWIRTFYFDRTGTLWLGTEGYGVLRHDPSAFRFNQLSGRTSEASGFWDSYLWDLKESEQGIWIAGRSEVGLINPRNHSYERLIRTETHPVLQDFGFLYAILPLTADQVLLGFNQEYLGVLDLRDSSYRRIPYAEESRSAPGFSKPIHELITTADGTIWILGKAGVQVLAQDLLQAGPPPAPLAAALQQSHVRTMIEQDDGVLWFGTEDNGLLRYHPDTGHTMTWHRGPGPEGLPQDGIRGLYLDDAGDLWIGTLGGLALLKSEDIAQGIKDLEVFTTAEGLPNNTIYDILPGENGTLWLSTNLGLSHFDPATRTFRNFDVGDGLANNEFNGGAALRDSRGWLYFGGIDGLTWFEPGTQYRNLTQPQVALTHLTIGDDQALNPIATSAMREVTLAWDRNTIEFEVAALCFQQPDKQRVAYRIKDLDSDWWEGPRNQSIRVTNLPAGDLQLEYKVSNNDGVWSRIDTILVRVGTPPWRTWQAIFGYVSLIVVIAWLLRRRQVHKRAQNETLTQQLILADKLKAVGQLAAGMAHDFNNHLQIIMGNAELMDLELSATHPGREPLKVIFRTGRRAGLLTSRLMAYAKETDPIRESLDLDEVVGGMLDLLGSFLGARIAFIHNPLPGVKAVHANREQLEQVIVNLCLNARDAIEGQGIIEIRTSIRESDAEGRWGVCEVRDSGSGISDQNKNRVFEPFYTTKEAGKGSGLGLSMARRIIERHGGQINVSDNELGGATLAIVLPCRDFVQTKTATPDHPGSDPTFSNEVILVADDDPDVNGLTTRILTQTGAVVISVFDGTEGIAALDAHPEITLAVLDVVMPVMDGRAVYDHIEHSGRDIPVLFCTGFSFSALKENEFKEIAVPVLAKPFDRQELLTAVAALRSRRSTMSPSPRSPDDRLE